MRSITKRFPGVLALDGVNFTLHRGEVAAVIGENGAGKSTLMKILGGVLEADSGEIRLEGRPVEIRTVQHAIAHRIALIHQERNLAVGLNIAENIFLGHEPRRWPPLPILDRRTLHRRARDIADRIGLDADTHTPVRRLSPGQRQMVEIARALSLDAQILVMDEPTSSLSQRETDALFQVIRELRDRGVSIVYISHRLGEVREVADRVVVLRDGRNAGELDRNAADHAAMVRLMVGRDLSQYYRRGHPTPGDLVLELRDVELRGRPGRRISFQVRRGEILMLAGLVGAGRTEIARALFGLDPIASGEVRLDGTPLLLRNPFEAIRCGFALVPEDRQLQGLILDMTVRENLSLAELRLIQRWGLWDRRRERAEAAEMIRRLGIRTPSLAQRARNLSGGNQQKLVLAKWLKLRPRVLILDEPTRGVDVGAKQEIYALIDELARNGVAILMISSEMEEVLGMSDRVVVIRDGETAGELTHEQLSEEAIIARATGAV
ncbi:MAG: sugar ABC transporter ATP-binding protein [Candidatus Sumerlaeia bacterium]|nr:sugar ABC transporter ATP-binding protein [Candidatus Sumerlaeia bacterium]